MKYDDFQTRPLIEESIINATKSLLTDEIFPNVNDAIQTEASKLTGLINEKDAKVETLEKRMAHEKEEFKGLIKGLVQKVTGLEESIASKDTENAQLKEQLNVSHNLHMIVKFCMRNLLHK